MLSIRSITISITFLFALAIVPLLIRHASSNQKIGQVPHYGYSDRKQNGRKLKYAFATFLSVGDNGSLALEDTDPSYYDERNGYYLSVRLLAYQLLHAPGTRAGKDIPFLVLATGDVPTSIRQQLTKDGATVILADAILSSWIQPNEVRWRDVLTKLRVFSIPKFDKICYMDADTFLWSNLNGIFEDPATDIQSTRSFTQRVQDHEGMLPPTYTFAGVPDVGRYDHDVPPSEKIDTLNSGFFVFRPSIPLFRYYASLLDEANREKLFDAAYPDQDVLNYAHRLDGDMPWKRLDWRWNANWPTARDVDAGVRSLHAKYWDGDPGHDKEILRRWIAVRDEMRVYYRGRDEALNGQSG